MAVIASRPSSCLLRAALLFLASLSLRLLRHHLVPTAQELAKAKWADVQAQYQRRADLVGNLVSTVKAAAKVNRTR